MAKVDQCDHRTVHPRGMIEQHGITGEAAQLPVEQNDRHPDVAQGRKRSGVSLRLQRQDQPVHLSLTQDVYVLRL